MNELKYARRVTTPDACSMDVPRIGVVAKKRKRGLITISAIALDIFIVTIGLSRLKPAVPLELSSPELDPRPASKQAAVDQAKHALTGDECGSAEPRLDLHDKNPQIIRSLEQQWAQAYANRDIAWLSCILDDDFEIGSVPDQACATHSKQNVLDWVATRTGSAELELLQIKPHDNTVIARGVYSVRRDGKLVSRFQFTDVFVYRSSRWQAVARTIAELPLK